MRMDALNEVLENLLNLHRSLLALAADKKRVLLAGEIDALVEITHQEQKLIKAVTLAEQNRIEIVQELLKAKGLPGTEGTIAGLLKTLTSAEEKKRLKNIREQLLGIVSELREANELNQQLLGQSLSFVNANLELLTDSPEEDFVYRKPSANTHHPYAGRSFLNTKA
ncbi:flagellar protein FlgN [Brevibacillus sp. B_LB10_24]|uniref:flagellar protein FlgN n=1 Tax=Brevibacillus sp. B_LB10_24 TaxID=3380645 RepID=UPI0038B8BED1